jgi:ubiquinone/menaquinone biosynthesis C-methylase UbiE
MNAPARFGRLAHAYRWMEYFSFGPYLKQCRESRISEMTNCRGALVFGDGDGRFLTELVRHSPKMQVTAVDASREMLRQTERRLPPEAQVRLVHRDALECEPTELSEAQIDLVVSHFFFDCFDEEELASLLATVNTAVDDSAIWVISDFAIPQRVVARQLGMLIVRGLYLAFGLLTGLRTRLLPDHGRVMREAGWVLEDKRHFLLGLLASERWRRSLRS